MLSVLLTPNIPHHQFPHSLTHFSWAWRGLFESHLQTAVMVPNTQPCIAEPPGLQNVRNVKMKNWWPKKIVEDTTHKAPAWALQEKHRACVTASLESEEDGGGGGADSKDLALRFFLLFRASKWVKPIKIWLTDKHRHLPAGQPHGMGQGLLGKVWK